MNAARRDELRDLASAFLRGELRPLEADLALSSFQEEVPEALQSALLSMVGVASEADNNLSFRGLMIGGIHPSLTDKTDKNTGIGLASFANVFTPTSKTMSRAAPKGIKFFLEIFLLKLNFRPPIPSCSGYR